MTDFSVMGMILRPFGATGLTLPSLSVGTAALGRPAYLNLDHAKEISDASVDGMRNLTHDVLDAAYAGGVRHFDTARSYGLAESFLSDWLGRKGYSDVVVTSKWGYRYVGDWQIDNFPHEIKDLSFEAFLEQSRETVQKFGNLLTGYQIHSATIDSGVLQDRGVLQALAHGKPRPSARCSTSVHQVRYLSVLCSRRGTSWKRRRQLL
jgi:aryl-alcohol dehydrogenase-like predicted oxidoreductase